MREDLSIEHLIGTSAELNGVVIPGRSLEPTLAKHAFNVFVGTDVPEFPVILRGTGTAVRFKGREIFLCTQHQLEGIDRQKVGMMTEGGGTLVTSGGMRHNTPTSETDAYDLVAFDFTEPVAAYDQFKPRFFNLSAPPRRARDPEVVGFLLTGCPFSDQLYDVAESNHIHLARRHVLCTLDQAAPADSALYRAIPREPLTFDPDGMSGGSSFAVVQTPDGFKVEFAGIIVRGGREAFHIIKGGVVAGFLKTSSDWGNRNPDALAE